ncbi:hypothetical protein HHK36_006488 [Tetracentron sinense]|uniref:Proteasome subunit beta n=1 Tax=Tetracentron sinense TaxID=13715 RepID=A0A834ZHA7_TETSI|nr:hypothetical protein HHK36_006488 [Tetracentron sinense]
MMFGNTGLPYEHLAIKDNLRGAASLADSSGVLAEHENNVTTLFRREKARGELGQTDAAQEDFLKPFRYAPEDKAITRDGFFARTAAMDFGLDLNAPHSMGTTIIGVTYNGGVVLGADSRTSTGMYVANRASDKITQLTDNVYLCRSGSELEDLLEGIQYRVGVGSRRNAFDGELDPLANLFTRLEVGTIEVEEGNHVFGNEILISPPVHAPWVENLNLTCEMLSGFGCGDGLLETANLSSRVETLSGDGVASVKSKEDLSGLRVAKSSC